MVRRAAQCRKPAVGQQNNSHHFQGTCLDGYVDCRV